MLKLIKNLPIKALVGPQRVSSKLLPRNFASDASKSPVKCGFYSKNVEDKINEQIAVELRTAYTYLSMECHFARSDVALAGCEKFFKMAAEEEKHHAMKLCDYQAYRGGTVHLMTIEKPAKLCYSVPDAFALSLQLEKEMTGNLIDLKDTAMESDDDVTVDFIVSRFLTEQVKISTKPSMKTKILQRFFPV